MKISDVECMESRLGNPVADGGLRMASSMMAALENGGLASVVCNYLKPRAFSPWGNECLRIFGTEGMLEAVDGGTRTRLILHDKDLGELDIREPSIPYHDLFFDEILGHGEFPISLEDELHPTRMLIRAKAKARLIY
ncbi:MAG: hypothetical protein D6820_17750 [Lentisphaerae bacterium]|nr:MAG: hypothetical protein D6820_17750 [Lentisphaerota bacterium]